MRTGKWSRRWQRPSKVMASGIYAIRNSLNGKMYIGSSKNIKSRWKSHKSDLRRGIHINIYLQNAWNKNGKECFDFIILEKCSPKETLHLEQLYLDEYQAVKNGYNLVSIAGKPPVKYGPPSIETRAKISKTLMGHHVSALTRKSVRKSNKERIVSKKTRQKMSDSHKKRYENPEARKIQSINGKKRFADPLEREKQSKCTTLWWKERKEKQQNILGVV